MKYCPNCRQNTHRRRNIGIGTIIMIMLTCLGWVIFIPFYRKRCAICGGT